MLRLVQGTILLGLILNGNQAGAAFTAQQLEQFEKEVRPVLAERCYQCHGPEKQKSGLRLDSRASLLRGSDFNVVVEVGKPETSKLVSAIKHAGGGVEPMPKEGEKLPEHVIAALERWIADGLPWPDEAAASPKPDPTKHWAFQPVRLPPAPQVKAAERVSGPLDTFVIAALEEKGMSLSRQADRATLTRRLYLDLTGLPPNWEQMQAAAADTRPDAVAHLVDDLLNSPKFGEHWARMWLDVARYADTKGYVFEEERRYPYAYTYRDWVIRVFNEDMPYDQFLVHQIAADSMALPDNPANLAALGFLTLGRRFLNNEPDIIDDRIDVVFRGTQALSLNCARCHDHKFDPIPTEDYYSLYGVFASTREPSDLPILSIPSPSPEYEAFKKSLAELEAKVTAFRDERHAALSKSEVLAKYLTTAVGSLEFSEEKLRQVAKDQGIYFNVLERWVKFIKQPGPGAQLIGALVAFAKAPTEFAKNWEMGKSQIMATSVMPLAAEVEKSPPQKWEDLAGCYARAMASALGKDAEFPVVNDFLRRNDGPLSVKPEDLESYYTRPERDHLRDIRKKIDFHQATDPAAPPRAMVVQDKPQAVEPNVFIRGSASRPGQRVPRRFLKVLSGPERAPFTAGSGRLELAKSIASSGNPLTARVWVNRLWAQLFHRPLVDTPSDFGVRTPPPTNPQLLDYLAATFMQNGWSLKKFVREIVLSSTYQQESLLRPDMAEKDPENRWHWRMNRKRLTYESMRDSILAVSGKLDATMYGRAVDTLSAPFTGRRSIYAFIDRQNVPGTFRSFDVASADAHSPKRYETTVPQQALFLLNSPFMQEQAAALAQGMGKSASPDAQIRGLFHQAFAREPSMDEVKSAMEYLSGGGSLENLAQAMLCSNEFMFVD